tara:strand:- start:34 stop:219 length:186 start_codon:yes stop_codon:yes gene_type:complete
MILLKPISKIADGKIYSTNDDISRIYFKNIAPKMIRADDIEVIIKFTGESYIASIMALFKE